MLQRLLSASSSSTNARLMHSTLRVSHRSASFGTLRSRPYSLTAASSSSSSSSSSSRKYLNVTTKRFSSASTDATPSSSSSTSPSSSSLASSASSSPPLPFAVVGSGPAAFYTTKYLLRELPNIRVDMFERLPVPYGLVRFGVAPDHPDVKQVIHDFEVVSNDSRFAYYGNVEIGKQISVEELKQHYAGVIFAYGAQSERTLSIPGSNLHGIHPSRHFVNWYNGHPEHGADEHDFDLKNVKNVVIIGQGNVAIDCARVLLASLNRLKPTDISTHAYEQLTTSSVQSVHMVGRRGAVQSAFSIGELRELATSVEGMRVVMSDAEFAASENEASLKEVETSRPKKRKHELMRSMMAGTLQSLVPHSKSAEPLKELHIRYLLNPKEFLPDEKDPTRVGAVVMERTELRGLPEHQEAVPTGETITIPTGLVLTSIGYRSLPIPGLPFDTRKHIVPNVASRVQDLEGHTLPGVYVAGWLKRGPSGIIATNIMDARETVKSIVDDLKQGVVKEPSIGTPLPFLSPSSIAANQIVDRVAWSRIDSHEQAKGLQHGKPRVKLVSKQHLLEAAKRS